MDDTELIKEVEDTTENESGIEEDTETIEETEQDSNNYDLDSVLLEEQEEDSESIEEFNAEEDSFESISLDSILSNQETIIDLLTESEIDVYFSNSQFNSNIISCFLLSALFGCFVASAFFRKW